MSFGPTNYRTWLETFIVIQQYVHSHSPKRTLTIHCTFRPLLRPKTRIMFSRVERRPPGLNKRSPADEKGSSHNISGYKDTDYGPYSVPSNAAGPTISPHTKNCNPTISVRCEYRSTRRYAAAPSGHPPGCNCSSNG